MSSLPHPVPSRTAQNIAALYGHEDENLIAWQRACAQAAEALRPQHESERLAKALTLAQNGDVVLEDDGTATVQGSGAQPYTVSGALCDCPDTQHRGTPCKHLLAVLIHTKAQALLAPSPSAPAVRVTRSLASAVDLRCSGPRGARRRGTPHRPWPAATGARAPRAVLRASHGPRGHPVAVPSWRQRGLGRGLPSPAAPRPQRHQAA